MALPALRERKHPYCGRPEYARGVRLSLGGSIYDPADPVSKMFFNMLAVFAEFEADLLKMRTREGMAHRPLPRQAQRQQAQAHHTPAGRVLDRAGARPGAGTGAQSYETVGEVVMPKEVLADGVRALVISQADEKQVVRLAEPLLHQPLRAGDSLPLESWPGNVYERIPRPRWKSSSWKKESGTN